MNVTGLSSLIANTSPVAGVIISVALMLFSGFAMTRLTKLARLPNVTGYILAGILIGPYVLNLVPQRIIDGTDFLSDIALAFIAFSTGEFFKLSVLKKSGMKVVWITIFEAVLASVFIFILTFLVLRLELAFSIVLSALASATAPASTMMTIRQTGAKGDFVDTLLQVVALDDVVGLVLYSIAISVALASLSGASGFSFETLGKPVLLNLLVLALGSAFGLFMKLLMPQKRSKDNKLIISVALLFAFCGVCALLDISPLLGCMMMGTVYTNIADDDKLFKQLNYFRGRRRLWEKRKPAILTKWRADLQRNKIRCFSCEEKRRTCSECYRQSSSHAFILSAANAAQTAVLLTCTLETNSLFPRPFPAFSRNRFRND